LLVQFRLDPEPPRSHTPRTRMLYPEMDCWGPVAPIRVKEDKINRDLLRPIHTRHLSKALFSVWPRRQSAESRSVLKPGFVPSPFCVCCDTARFALEGGWRELLVVSSRLQPSLADSSLEILA